MPVATSIRDLLHQQYGAAVAPRFPSNVTVLTTVSEILKQDPSRIGLAFVNVATNDVSLIPTGQTGAQKGFVLAANGGSIVLDWREDGELCSQAWNGLAIGASASILIVEDIIQKEGGEDANRAKGT